MVKNITGGNKTKKQSRSVSTKFNAVAVLEQGQMYGQITAPRGDYRFFLICSDGVTRVGRLSGHMRKGQRMSVGSFVVVSLRDFEQDQKKCDILSLGNPPHDIISIFRKNDTTQYKDDNIEFVESDDEFNEFDNLEELDQSRNRNFDMPPSDSEEEDEEEDAVVKEPKVEVVQRKGKDIRAEKKIEKEDEEIDWNDL
jgi:initiation factor 1A